jgi:hypothetical protein
MTARRTLRTMTAMTAMTAMAVPAAGGGRRPGSWR